MAKTSTAYWPGHSMQSHTQAQLSPPHSQLQNEQQMHPHQNQQQGPQAHFLPPTSTHHVHAQYNMRQPELQLEHFHDQGGIDGLGALSYNALQPQSIAQHSVVLGVGQGPGNAEAKYTAPTATALAARACPPDAFQFGQQVEGSSQGTSTSPESLSGGRQPFNTSFSFVSAPGSAGSGMSEGVSPHEAFRAQVQATSQHEQDYLNSRGYVPHQKRRREDTGPDPFPSTDASGSGDEDAEYGGQYAYGSFGEQYEGYSRGLGQTGMVVQSPELLSQVHPGLGTLGQGAGYAVNADQRGGQSGQGQQMGSDGKAKQVHRAACVRCKNLKVRCEFPTDPNTCRRCLNGGHECAIPGRKKRRQPPKREHLLNQIRDQAQQIEKLMQQLEEHRRARLHNEPTRLSLSNTPLPPPGATPVAGQPPSSYAPGGVPRPDVQAWIERARESIQAIGAFMEGEEDIEEEGEDEEGEDTYDGEEGYFDEQNGEQQWRGPAGEQDSDTEEGDIVVEGPDGADHSDERRSVRQASPATTVRSASREGSAPPQFGPRTQNQGQGAGRGGRRRTPQPARLAPLPATPAAPLKLIADLSLRSGNNRQGSKSPKSASLLGMSSHSRASSIEVDPPSSATAGGSSPKSMGAVTEKPHVGGSDAGAQAQAQAEVAQEATSDGEYGAVAPGFFEARRGSVPDPSRLAPARHPVPHILMRGIVTPQEVEVLFKIYFDKMNLSCSLLDPVLYTAQTTYWRSPFLFTVICAVASRYYADHPGIYEELITYAQLAAGTALISGPKNVETVSAYILLSLYPVPMRRWEEDRTWLYLGLAIRVATDLNLHHPTTARPRNEQHARELLNRTRVWLNCYNLDVSTSSWHGKASTIASGDYIACHSEDWYESSAYNMPNFDIQLSGYNFELRLMREFKEKIYNNPNNPTGLNKDLDFIKLSSETDETLVLKEKEWNERLRQKTDPDDAQGRFRNSLVKLAYRYNRLTVLSFGFQHSFGKGSTGNSDQTSFFDRCYRAATDVLRVFIDELSTQKEYIRHGPEAQCVFVTFASAFLIKLLHPKYAPYLKIQQRRDIEQLVRGIIDLLSSPEVVVDDRHSPKLWSSFLDGLLATPMAKVELSPGAMKGGNSLPRRSARRSTTHTTNSSSSKRGSPSLASSLSFEADSPSGQSTNSSYPASETHATSPASGFSGTMSPPPPILPVSAPEDRYPAPCDESPNAAFDFGQTQSQQGFEATSNSMMTHSQGQQGMYDMQNSLQMDVPEFFQPPLPFDSDLLQSMQSMPDSSIWQNMPGFNWMGILQSTDQDSTMQDVLAPGMMSYDINNIHSGGNHY